MKSKNCMSCGGPMSKHKVGGKVKKAGLKEVPPNKKGLKKLPTFIRNKMGYAEKGGKVK